MRALSSVCCSSGISSKNNDSNNVEDANRQRILSTDRAPAFCFVLPLSLILYHAPLFKPAAN